MYLKEKKLRLLRIKNVIFALVGIFNVLTCGYYIISEFTYYRDDPNTALHAVSMKSSIVWTIIGTILLIQAAVSRNRIGYASFFSGYFEGDLDGYVKCRDLAQVTGNSAEKVRKQLRTFRRHYMKGFELKEINGEYTAELYSKKCLCECRSCGAQIEKRIFFTGTCPYCDSSDLFANVVTNERFYSISNEFGSGVQKPDYYTAKHLKARKVWFMILFSLGALAATIGILMTLTEIPHYFDREYQKKILLSPDNHLFSYELIKADILDTIIFSSILFLIFAPLAVLRLRKTASVYAADIFAGFFSRCRKPIVKAEYLPDLGAVSAKDKKLKSMRQAIHRGYLVHCTLEMHGGELTAALAKKIVKDKCPSCGAPIVGAVDENHTCEYCGKLIMGVVERKL